MASSKSRSRLLRSLLVLVSLCHVPFAMSQTPSLNAVGTGQSTATFMVYFAEGENTANIGFTTLPICSVSGGSGNAIYLEKQDGSLIAGQRIGAFDSSIDVTNTPFNKTAHPVLTKQYSGVYHCRTVTTANMNVTSDQTYHLNVVVPLLATPVPSSAYVYNTTNANQVLTCGVTGYGRTRVSWTSSVTLTSNTTQRMPAARMDGTQQRNVSSTLSFAGNDTGISIGVPFTVTCVAEYTDVVCTSGSDSQANVQTNCQNASRPLQSTITVTAQATECPRIIDLRSNTNATTSTPNTVRSIVNLGCMQGYNLTASFPLSSHDVLEVTCSVTGEWDRLPFCNITHCQPLNGAGFDQPIPGLEVGENASVECMDNYQSLLSAVVCHANGSWTDGPYCDFDACQAGQDNCKPTSNCTYSTGSFTCNCSDGACSFTDCPMFSGSTIEDVPQTSVTPLMPTNHTVVCKTGYEIPVPAIISCQRNGTWSNGSPNCSVKVTGSPGPDLGVIVGCVVGALVAAIIVVCVIIYLKKRKGDGAKSLTDGSKGARPVPTTEDGVVPAIDEHELAALRQPRVDTRGPPPPDSDPTNTFEPGQRIPIGDHSRLLNDPRGGTGSNGDEGHYDAFVRDNQAAPQPAPAVDDSATYDHIVRPVNPDSVALPPIGPNSSYEQIRLPGEPAQQPAPNNPTPGADAAAEAAEPQPPDAQYAMVDLSKKSRR